jgi:hypothetical protein
VTPDDWLTQMSPPFSPKPDTDLRARHWAYFTESVEPIIYRALDMSFPVSSALDRRVREFVMQRVRIRHRFRPSEPIFFISEDKVDRWGKESPTIAMLAAGLELLQFSRLIADDVIDQHTHRWGQATLWALEGQSGSRAEHMRQVAHLTSAVLAKLSLMCFEKAEHLARDEGLVDDTPLSWPQAGLEASHDMWACMLDELAGAPSPRSFSAYADIARRKHCNGALTATLLRPLFAEPAEWSALDAAIRATDLAASIANDFSEVNGQRGFGAPRTLQTEPRGERTEVQLGRPHVFSTFHGEDGFIRSWIASGKRIAQLEDLGTLSQEELENQLVVSGCLKFAMGQHSRLKDEADDAIGPTGLVSTTLWVSNSAKIHGRPSDGVTSEMLTDDASDD